MATYNQNYESIILSGGNSFTLAELGDGHTATTVHNIFCVSGGTIQLQSMGGTGNGFTWTATPGQNIDIIVGSCTVVNGLFVGFRAKKSPGPYRL